MKRMKLMSRCYFALLMMVLFAAPAFAYLDPGTLSYVISMIAGLFIAGGAAIAIFRRKIKLFFQNLGKKKQEGEQTATEPWRRTSSKECIRPNEPSLWRRARENGCTR